MKFLYAIISSTKIRFLIQNLVLTVKVVITHIKFHFKNMKKTERRQIYKN